MWILAVKCFLTFFQNVSVVHFLFLVFWMSFFLCLQLSQKSFFLLCNQSIFFTPTCQRRPSLSNWKQQWQHAHKKKLHFPRVPLCLVAFGWGASLIQKSIQFCRIDSQPPDRQKAASSPRFDWRRCLIQAQMSAPEHWLLTKTKINQAHSDRARYVRLPAAVMWLVAWKIDLTASKCLCEHCGPRCVL